MRPSLSRLPGTNLPSHSNETRFTRGARSLERAGPALDLGPRRSANAVLTRSTARASDFPQTIQRAFLPLHFARIALSICGCLRTAPSFGALFSLPNIAT